MQPEKRILIVEDDEAILEVLTLIFSQMNYQVISFTDGRRILSGEHPAADLFLFDMQLPGPNGLSLCTFLKGRADMKHIPVVTMSASPRLKSEAYAAGADAFLEKPFQMSELIGLVNQLIGSEMSI